MSSGISHSFAQNNTMNTIEQDGSAKNRDTIPSESDMSMVQNSEKFEFWNKNTKTNTTYCRKFTTKLIDQPHTYVSMGNFFYMHM